PRARAKQGWIGPGQCLPSLVVQRSSLERFRRLLRLYRIPRQQQPQRQADPRLQATAFTVAQLDDAAMLRGDALDDGQAEARALAAACAVAANEGVEDLVELVRIDAGAAVEHAEHHIRRVVVAGHARHHLDTITAVALRVLDQVD